MSRVLLGAAPFLHKCQTARAVFWGQNRLPLASDTAVPLCLVLLRPDQTRRARGRADPLAPPSSFSSLRVPVVLLQFLLLAIGPFQSLLVEVDGVSEA